MDLRKFPKRDLARMARDALVLSMHLRALGNPGGAWRSGFLATAIAMELARREGMHESGLPDRAAKILGRETLIASNAA